MATFDESKPYGNVRGSSGIRYEQDGHLFDGQKREVDVDGNPMKAAAKKSAPAKKSASKPAPEGVRPMSEQVEDSE